MARACLQPPLYFRHFHLLYLLRKHGQLTVYLNFPEAGNIFLFDNPLPLVFFCTLPSLPRRDIQDGGQSRSRDQNVFCISVCKQSRRCLTHDFSYIFWFYGVQYSLELLNERARNFVIVRKKMCRCLFASV